MDSTKIDLDLSQILTPNLTLDELEDRLVTDNQESNNEKTGTPKQIISDSLIKTQKSILPLRLAFNNFIQIMSTIDNMPDKSSQEKFTLIKSLLIDINDKITDISGDFEQLQPLFSTIDEYSEKNGNKTFHLYETLKPVDSPNNTVASKTAKGNASHAKKKSTGSTPGSTTNNTSVASTPNVTTTGTVASNTNNNTAASKKPRKPRQNKKTTTTTKAQQKQSPVNNVNPTPGMNSVSPSNVLNTPMSSMMSPMAALSAQPPISQQQFNQQRPQSQMPMNTITPANILNMSLGGDSQTRSQTMQQQQQDQQQFGNNTLDLNNLDLSGLNMDFL